MLTTGEPYTLHMAQYFLLSELSERNTAHNTTATGCSQQLKHIAHNYANTNTTVH